MRPPQDDVFRDVRAQLLPLQECEHLRRIQPRVTALMQATLAVLEQGFQPTSMMVSLQNGGFCARFAADHERMYFFEDMWPGHWPGWAIEDVQVPPSQLLIPLSKPEEKLHTC